MQNEWKSTSAEVYEMTTFQSKYTVPVGDGGWALLPWSTPELNS